MDRIDEILYLHEDGVVEMKQGGRVPFQSGGTTKQITFSVVEDFIRNKKRNPTAKELIKLTEKINDTIKETVDKKDFFKKRYNISLRGDETERELKYLTELLDDFEKNLPNASPKDKLATYQFGKKRKLQSIARSYDKYGKEAIDEAAKILRQLTQRSMSYNYLSLVLFYCSFVSIQSWGYTI